MAREVGAGDFHGHARSQRHGSSAAGKRCDSQPSPVERASALSLSTSSGSQTSLERALEKVIATVR
jgi:hypothetical protein